MIKRCIAFQLPLKVPLVVLKLALLDGINAIASEVEHLGKAANLRGHIGDVESALAVLTLLEESVKCRSHHVLQLQEPDLHLAFDRDGLSQGHLLISRADHRLDLRVLLVEGNLKDATEELLEVALDDGRVLGLAQDLKQVIVTNEIEAGEFLALLL